MQTLFDFKKARRLALGLLTGIVFGFFLQKAGVTDYDVIIAQLLLIDFTVAKVMLSAVITGMIGIYFLRGIGRVQLQPKPGSWGATAVGGLIFGLGFGILGYCPGTAAGAVGQGYLDALFAGIPGILIGTWLFALAYPWLNEKILQRGDFGQITLPELLGVKAWIMVASTSAVLIFLLLFIEGLGL